jgi:ribosomal protein S13
MEKNMKLLKNLKKIYGISETRGKKICIYIGVSPEEEYRRIPGHKKYTLKRVLNHYRKQQDETSIAQNLVKYTKTQKERKKKINSLIGRRLRLGLPTRGQRTRCNGTRKNQKIKKEITLRF